MRKENTTFPTDTVTLFKLLADDTRLRLIRILAREDCYVELLASRLGLTPATVCYHLKKLEAVGLVRSSRSQFYIIYALDHTVLDHTLADLILDTPAETEDADAAYEREVLSRFFKYGRLLRLPTQQKKQVIILREIARRFTPDTDYTEKEVNAVILELFDDFCAIRRGLITAGLMTRHYEAGRGDIYRLTWTRSEPPPAERSLP